MKNKKKYEQLVNEALKEYFKHIREMRIKEVLDKAEKYRKDVNILFTEEIYK